MDLFREDNTEGYTLEELNRLNSEWEQRVSDTGLEEFTEDYYKQASRFVDEISRR